MTTPPEQWIRIDAAAAGLGVGIYRAYQIAKTDHWRKTGGKPARYALSDVRRSHARRTAKPPASSKNDPALAEPP